MKTQRWHGLIGAWLALLLASLACTINIGGPTPPAPPPTTDPAQLTRLRNAWKAAIKASTDGQVTVTVTEEQLTALLAAKLANSPNAFFQQPQVTLQDGKMQIYGQAQKANVVANIRIVVTVSIDTEGKPQFHLASADFGPWPAPAGLLKGLSDMLNEAFTGKIGPAATGIRLESITIANGVMTIQGRIR